MFVQQIISRRKNNLPNIREILFSHLLHKQFFRRIKNISALSRKNFPKCNLKKKSAFFDIYKLKNGYGLLQFFFFQSYIHY